MGSFDCFFADGPATTNVTATVTDSDGASDTDNQFVTVTVANLAPVVTAAADQSSDEGQDVAFDLGSFSDAGANDADWTVDIDWGDSSSDTFDAARQGGLGTLNHTYADDGLYSVEVCVTDKDLARLTAPASTSASTTWRRWSPPPPTRSRTRAPPRPLISAASAMRATTTPWTVIVDWGDLSSDTFTDSEASAGAITDRSHTYADNGTYNVTVTVREAGGVSAPSGSASFDVTVANLAPVLTAAADQGSDEGQDVAFDLGSFSDAGANDADWTVDIDWGDSSSDTFDAARQGGLGALNHTYADDGLYSVEVCVTDKDLASDCATFEITVDNVAPTIALSGDASVDEGSLYSLTLGAVTDPGDDTVIEWIVDWGDGAVESYFADGVVTHTYADGPADYTISVDLLDEDGTHLAAGSHDVHVDNVKPSISLSGPDTANEGDTETYTFLVIDPGVNDTQTITVDCGANGAQVGLTDYNPLDGMGSFDCFFADGPATTNVTATVTDSDGASDTDNQFVTVIVANLAPVVTAAADQGSDEGQDVAFDLGSFSDAGANDADWTVDIDWGDSSSDTFDAALQGGLGTFNHTYADDGLYSVEVCVTDKDWRDRLRQLRHQRRQRGAGGHRRRRPDRGRGHRPDL